MDNQRTAKHAKFIAVDGESVTDELGHRYVMLCASTGDTVESKRGLSSEACFEFLLELRRNNPDYTFVGFGFNYDVNMMLRDIAKDQLKQLWNDREATIFTDTRMYNLTYIPSKFVGIKSDVYMEVQDVFGFFQTSFLKALEDWDIPDEDGTIERMKEGRSEFGLDDMPEMKKYCLIECTKLVELCEKLQDSLIDAGLKVTRWIGAGSVGNALIKKYKVLEHHYPDYKYPPELQRAIMYAYYGGRFEMFRQGHFEDIYNYDIISAYPYACLSLPSLIGTWEHTKNYDPDSPFAVWKTEWKLPSDRVVMPFPYRYKGGIYTPYEGKGWYWGNEVKAALAMHPEIKVTEGFKYHPVDDDVKPFAFLTEVWEKRKEAKSIGLASQKAYKLGMNSLYGKLAQGRGFQGTIPRQRSFVWAGMICSDTRATLLRLLNGQQDKVISVATDGLFFKEDPGYVTGNNLGDLEVNSGHDFYQFLNGIYYSRDIDNTKAKTRGHAAKEIDWDDVCRVWDTDKMNGTYRYKARRFIGLGQALMLKDFDLWRTWKTFDRQLHLHQWLRKYLDDKGYNDFMNEEYDDEYYLWLSGNFDGMKLGQAYKPKTDIHSAQSSEERESVLALVEDMEQPTLFI